MVDDLLPSEYYNANLADRKEYETRAEEIAAVSLPYMIRIDGADKSTKMAYKPSQSFNGRLINNLKAKMGMALLPPSTSSFRLQPDAIGLMELYKGNESQLVEIAQELSMLTDVINTEIESQQIRSDLFDLLLQMIGVGSVIVEKSKDNGIILHTLKSFIVTLDNKGEAVRMCIMETLRELPENITPKEVKDEYELFTMLTYDTESKVWIETQDIDGELVGSEITYQPEKLPYNYLGWTWMVGDKYHRPFAEDYIGDMTQLNNLAKLNTEGALVAAKIVVYVNPRGNRTSKADLTSASNGAVLDGSSDDVTAFQLEKNFDFQVSNDREAVIKKELKECFLDSGAVTRDAERVTAEEIRVMAQQLESSTLAGIYSRMSMKWQKWIIEMVINELGIKFEATDVDVLTGLDALGRSQEAQRLDALVTRIAQLQLTHYLKDSELINRYASYEGVNIANLVKTPDEVKEELEAQREAANRQAMEQAGAEETGKSGAKAIVEGAAGTAAPQQQG